MTPANAIISAAYFKPSCFLEGPHLYGRGEIPQDVVEDCRRIWSPSNGCIGAAVAMICSAVVHVAAGSRVGAAPRRLPGPRTTS